MFSISNKNNFISFFIIFFSLLISLTLIASAQSPEDNITFPIPELGDCQNKEECKVYCDDLSHINECVDFAERNGLMSSDEAELARKFARSGGEGPGNCRGHEECESYCEDIRNIEECLSFAEEHDVLDGVELDEARRVAKALKEGAELPGGCQNKNECEIYCNDPENIDECLAFAEAAGFIPPEELENAKKFADFMKRGETPGGCRGHEECEAYCNNENNTSECSEFAVKAGLISQEEAEIFKKTGGKGPGGCVGRECETFCEDPNNQEICFNFAKEHGFISEEDLERMEEGRGSPGDFMSNAPPEVMDCVRERIGDEAFESLKNGEFVGFGRDGEGIDREVEECFRNNFGHDGDGEHVNVSPNLPPEIIDCVRAEVGEGFEEAMREGDDKIRVIVERCFEKFEPDFGGHHEDGDFHDDRFLGPPENFDEFRDDFPEDFNPENFEEFKEHFPEDFNPEDFEGEFRPEKFDDFRDSQEFNNDHEGSQDFERDSFDEFRVDELRDFESDHQNFESFDDSFNREAEDSFKQDFQEDFDADFQRQIEEEMRLKEEEFRRQQEAEQQHQDDFNDSSSDGSFDGGSAIRRFLSPSAFSPRNLGQQAASLLPFIINR